MSQMLTVNVTNLQGNNQGFYFFQQPPLYTGGPHVYSNALWGGDLGNFDNTGGMLTFIVGVQNYAGIQQAHGQPVVGEVAGFASAMQKIDLASASGAANDSTTAIIDPLGLSPAVSHPGVQRGAFRINTPSYAPPAAFNIGSAVRTNEGVVLSSFVAAEPDSRTDCQPVLKYYVATGDYTPGTVVDFNQASENAALCDFTGGHTIIDVSLHEDGTWSTTIVN